MLANPKVVVDFTSVEGKQSLQYLRDLWRADLKERMPRAVKEYAETLEHNHA